MKVLIIYAHPWDGSFNHSILESVKKGLSVSGHETDCIDLVKDGFNPVTSEKELAVYHRGESLDPAVKDYQARIAESDYLFFIFPNWWGGMPAIMKGFIDKVFLKNFAYKEDPAPGNGLLNIKGASVIITFDASSFIYQILFKSHIKKNIVFQILRFNGIKTVKIFTLCNVKGISEYKRKKFLEKIGYFSKRLK